VAAAEPRFAGWAVWGKRRGAQVRHSFELSFFFRGGYFLGGLAADCLKNANASLWFGTAGQECRYW